MQVNRKCNINGIRDASVKLPIKMAVKNEQEEADVVNMVELLSSPHDQLSILDLSTQGILSHPQLTSLLMALSFSQVLDPLVMCMCLHPQLTCSETTQNHHFLSPHISRIAPPPTPQPCAHWPPS